MEVSSQLSDPAALPQGKRPWYPLDRRLEKISNSVFNNTQKCLFCFPFPYLIFFASCRSFFPLPLFYEFHRKHSMSQQDRWVNIHVDINGVSKSPNSMLTNIQHVTPSHAAMTRSQQHYFRIMSHTIHSMLHVSLDGIVERSIRVYS
jgi:hypothetical protein